MMHTYSRAELPCEGGDCGLATKNTNNYWRCRSCSTRSALDTMISTLRGYDIERRVSGKRLGLRGPLPVSAELYNYQRKFIAAGGRMQVNSTVPTRRAQQPPARA